jgi:hypothetical protein
VNYPANPPIWRSSRWQPFGTVRTRSSPYCQGLYRGGRGRGKGQRARAVLLLRGIARSGLAAGPVDTLATKFYPAEVTRVRGVRPGLEETWIGRRQARLRSESSSDMSP